MALNKNLIHVCKDQRFNVSNNRYKVCLIFQFNKKVFICFYIVDLKILTYRLTKPFNIKKQLPLLQKDPDQLTSQPCSHWPVMWLQKVLRLQYPIHLCSQYFPYHPWEHAVEGKFAFTILIYFKPVVKRLNDRLFIIYLSKENVRIYKLHLSSQVYMINMFHCVINMCCLHSVLDKVWHSYCHIHQIYNTLKNRYSQISSH